MSRARLFDTVLDATGRPVVGASVQVYQPNTTTPISETLYADDIGGTTLANPLATGANGSFLAYLDVPRRVDLYITAVGQTPRTVPDVGLFPDPVDFTTDTDLGNHVGAADPHGVYQRESEKGANNGYAGLGAGGLVPVAQLATGTPNGTKFYRDDGTLQVPAGATVTTTRGDIIKRGAAVDERLAIGTIGQGLVATDIGGGVLEPRYATRASGQAVGSTSGPTTTSTSYVDLTEMSVTVTPIGSVLIATFAGSFFNSGVGNGVIAAFSLDAAAEVGEQAFNAAVVSLAEVIPLVYRWPGLTPGTSYTVKVRWKVSAGTGTAVTTRRTLVVQEG